MLCNLVAMNFALGSIAFLCPAETMRGMPFLKVCNWSLVARLIADEKREKQAPASKTRLRPRSSWEPNTCTGNSVTDIM